VVAVLESGLPFSPFTNARSPLRESGPVPNFPSAVTFRKIAREIVEVVPANIAETLSTCVVHITVDFTPALDKRELAVINIHFWKYFSPDVVTLGLVEVEGSMTASAIVDMVSQVLELYGVESTHRVTKMDRKALQLGGCSDSGANAAKATAMLTTPCFSASCAELPDFKGFSPCLAHCANLLIKDALNHEAVLRVVDALKGWVKCIRKSRNAMECIAEQGISPPGRFVSSRWRSFMHLIRYFIKHATKLSHALPDLCMSNADVQVLRVVHALLEPVDLFIARAQADVAGDPFFFPLLLAKILAKMRKLQGFRMLVRDSEDATEPLGLLDLGSHLMVWKEFVQARFEERFFSLETHDFEDIVAEESENEDEDEDEDADKADDAFGSDSDSDTPPHARAAAGKGRFRRFNVLMNSFTLAAYGCSPLRNAWNVILAEGALEGENATGIAGEENVDGIAHLLQVRYLSDFSWSTAVDNPSSPAAIASAGNGSGAVALLQQQQGSVRRLDPMRAARSCVEEFTASSDLGDLFIRFLSTPESEQTLEAQRRFIYEWVGLADKHASWLGKLLRIVLVAPCRSTKCESDFSLVQHILAPRRLRMSRTTLAAYLFCKRARSFVTQAKDETGVTKAGTKRA
jgi:hypothetical protein